MKSFAFPLKPQGFRAITIISVLRSLSGRKYGELNFSWEHIMVWSHYQNLDFAMRV